MVDSLRAATFTSNYQNGDSWVVGHIWSLSTEEQFYLVWPCLLLLCGRKYAIIPATIMSVFPFIGFAVTHLYLPAHDWHVWNIFTRGMSGIGAGCVLAFIKSKLRVSGVIAAMGVFVGLLAMWFTDNARVYALLDSLSIFGIALCIAWTIDHASTSVVSRFLNLRVMRWLGVLSYSLYLWQMPFLNHEMKSVYTSFPLNLLLTFICACVSYYGVEKYFLALRKRLEKRSAIKATFALASLC